MQALTVTRSRLERKLADRTRFRDNIEEILKACEDEGRDPTETETEHLDRYRLQIREADVEIETLTEDLERADGARDVSRLLRTPSVAIANGANGDGAADADDDYPTFARYARDELIVRFPIIAGAIAGAGGMLDISERAEKLDRVKKRVSHTTTSDIPGLLPPTHLAQILDIINGSRPVVASGRSVALASGSLTYPKISQRPQVIKQTSEKTEGGTLDLQATLETLAADTYIGGGNLSWQAINWSSPEALGLWFDLAAEAYARATETAACSELGTAGGGTSSPALGTAGTEDFAGWQAAVMAGIASIYNTTGGRCRTDTLWLSPTRFFQLAKLGTAAVLQVSAVGGLNVESMQGTWMGLRVIGSYGFTGNAAIVGDGQALLVAETAGAPVQLRAVEPTIGGMEVGVIGAFKAKVYDANRFIHVG
jgi:HK97 family phage major capsid protein